MSVKVILIYHTSDEKIFSTTFIFQKKFLFLICSIIKNIHIFTCNNNIEKCFQLCNIFFKKRIITQTAY